METKKFKVGDKVRVKSLEWYNGNKNEKGNVIIDTDNCVNFTAEMSRLCGEIMQVEEMRDYYYVMNGSIFAWQDWMLEDEVVVPDAPDALKKWTISEARKYLAGKKLFCTNYHESENLQRKLFECGCYWNDIMETIDKERWAIYISYSPDGQMYHDHQDVFEWHLDNREVIKVEDVLKMEIIQDKPKFDPHLLIDFQKVLYRSSNADWWRLGFFDTYNEIQNKKFWMVGQDMHPYEQCVPYNHETEHLKGKCLDAPDYYRNW